MKKVKLYKYLVFLLAALNIAILAFFFLTAPKLNDKHKPPHEVLNLNQEQEEVLFELIEEHRTGLKPNNEQQKRLREELFNLVAQKADSSEIVSIKNQLLQLEEQRMNEGIEHLLKVKALLNEDQKVNFKLFLERLESSKNQRNRPPRKRNK